jgi:hypothetical protein
MYSIRRFGVVRTATIVAVMYLIVTAVIVVPIVVLGGIAAVLGGQGGAVVVGIAVTGLIIGAIYGVMGWVFTALACLLYNLAAGWVGGIELQLEAVAAPATPTWGAGTATGASPPPA